MPLTSFSLESLSPQLAPVLMEWRTPSSCSLGISLDHLKVSRLRDHGNTGSSRLEGAGFPSSGGTLHCPSSSLEVTRPAKAATMTGTRSGTTSPRWPRSQARWAASVPRPRWLGRGGQQLPPSTGSDLLLGSRGVSAPPPQQASGANSHPSPYLR